MAVLLDAIRGKLTYVILIVLAILAFADVQRKDLILQSLQKPPEDIQHKLEEIQGGGSGDLWAIIVGVNEYRDKKIRDLRYAVADAEAIQGIISDRKRMPYRNLISLVYTDNSEWKPTRRDILKGLNRVSQETKAEDTVLFFFSGHGVDYDGTSYLLPNDTDGEMIEDSAIALEDIDRKLSRTAAQRQVIILDACHSGGQFITHEQKTKEVQPPPPQSSEPVITPKIATQSISLAEGRVVLSSSRGGEVSYEYDEKKHGVFTYFFVEGLEGHADSDLNGYITVDEAYKYVYQKVTGWAKERNYSQTPSRETKASGEIVLTITPQAYLESSAVAEEKPANVVHTDVIIAPFDGAEMVLIPGGSFIMGSAPGEGEEDEMPQHEVSVDDFYIDLHEVTNAQYRMFLDATGHPKPPFWDDPKFNDPNQPVVGVSWFDAHEYAKWVGRRLPTEAEWEKAARGTDRRIYPFGDEWVMDISPREMPAPVGSNVQDTSFYGIVDMAGNVAEWVADFYDKQYYRSSTMWKNPTGPQSGGFMKLKVIRGASWRDISPGKARCANRNHNMPSMKLNFVGFRLAMDAKKP